MFLPATVAIGAVAEKWHNGSPGGAARGNSGTPGSGAAQPSGAPSRAGQAPGLLLERTAWTALEADHQRQVDELTADHRARSAHHAAHPVEDFLFTYYSFRPAQLRRWHPGAGVGLLDAQDRSGWRFQQSVMVGAADRLAVALDIDQFYRARKASIGFIRQLLAHTQAATPHFGCFGLHEWAMVFEDGRRHTRWPLRLGQDGTDEVLRIHQIRCSHFDAFRFFTPAAKPRNALTPDLGSRDRMEQPGCLHASMDLYKWAFRLTPVVSSELVLRCFRLARQIREVDMRASPYDLSELGYSPITIETAAGKQEYTAAQRNFAAHGQLLRTALRTELDQAFDQDGSLALW